MDKNIFQENLILTQIYCEQQLLNGHKNAASIFRSINPIQNGKRLFEFKISNYGQEPDIRYWFSTEWTQDPTLVGSKLIDELFDIQRLQKRASIHQNARVQNPEGKILVAEIDNTVTDGASEVCSGGLIDLYDCPPIDTWFFLSRNSIGRLLFAWIPKQFVHNANEAIEVNCVGCLYWHEGSTIDLKT